MNAVPDVVGDYNSQRSQIVLKEYGRNIQQIAEQIATLPDEEDRTRQAEALLALMKQLNPKLKDSQDIETKLWHHLHIVSNNSLNLPNSPEQALSPGLNINPEVVPYTTDNVKLKNFGKNIEKIAEETAKIEDPEKREERIIYLAQLMKRYYNSWNNEKLEDTQVIALLDRMTQGKLSISLTKVQEEDLFNVSYRQGSTPKNSSRADTTSTHKRQNSSGRGTNNRGNNSSNSSNRGGSSRANDNRRRR
jgi:hypothetical protein